MRVHLQWEMAASPEGDAASPAGYAASPARDTGASPKSWICDTTLQDNGINIVQKNISKRK
jgi:hypothetical protein